MQRVRIGLTGLAFVFILVLLGAIFSRATEEEPITANLIDRGIAGGNGVEVEASAPKEPLAELGVVPGNVDENAAAANEAIAAK